MIQLLWEYLAQITKQYQQQNAAGRKSAGEATRTRNIVDHLNIVELYPLT
jgi:hypothetical protein